MTRLNSTFFCNLNQFIEAETERTGVLVFSTEVTRKLFVDFDSPYIGELI